MVIETAQLKILIFKTLFMEIVTILWFYTHIDYYNPRRFLSDQKLKVQKRVSSTGYNKKRRNLLTQKIVGMLV